MASHSGRLNDGVKQRIVGALVLAALAVIFLPSLFSREGVRYIDVTSQIPPPPAIQPIEIAEPQPVADIAPAPEPDQLFQPREEAPAPEPSRTSADSETPPPAQPVLDEQGLPLAWVVQVAAYREPQRAERLRMQLMDEGYKAYTREVSTDKGPVVRVFVGPKVSREEAAAAKQELDQLLNTQSLVLRL